METFDEGVTEPMGSFIVVSFVTKINTRHCDGCTVFFKKNLRFVLPTTRLNFSSVSSSPFVSSSWHTFKKLQIIPPNELTSFNL